MRENFLRPPGTVGEWIADLLRVAGVLCIAVAAIGWTWTDAGIVALALPALVAPKFIGVRAWFDIAYEVTVLVAAWSNVFDLYTTVVGWDLIVHFTLTGLSAALMYVLLARADIVALPGGRRAAPIVLATTMGLALSALWEMVEWIGWTLIGDDIFVAYQDSIGDMVAGGLGALAAGLLLSSVSVLRPDADRLVARGTA
ncbi:MAG TPA: hypothetical protein VEX88_00125 [Glaciibacter sp.]|nr:hypothetical protein [Glaciibacter sp.]